MRQQSGPTTTWSLACMGMMLLWNGVSAPPLDAAPIAPSTTQTRTVFHDVNHVGHVVLERDAAGVVLDTPHRYTPYGVLLGDDVTPQEAPRFGGTLRDPVSGLDDFHMRHFASDYGRFLSSDGAHDGSNYYTYANNNPLKYADPDGRQSRAVVIPARTVARIEETMFQVPVRTANIAGRTIAGLNTMTRGEASELAQMREEARCYAQCSPFTARMMADGSLIYLGGNAGGTLQELANTSLGESFFITTPPLIILGIHGFRSNRAYGAMGDTEATVTLLHELMHQMLYDQQRQDKTYVNQLFKDMIAQPRFAHLNKHMLEEIVADAAAFVIADGLEGGYAWPGARHVWNMKLNTTLGSSIYLLDHLGGTNAVNPDDYDIAVHTVLIEMGLLHAPTYEPMTDWP